MAIRSDAQRRAVAKYNSANYEQIQVRVKTGRKAEIEAHAKRSNTSVNAYINQAIDERIKRDNVNHPAGENDGAGAAVVAPPSSSAL